MTAAGQVVGVARGGRRRRWAGCAIALGLLFVPLRLAAQGQLRDAGVRYRSAETVYLDAGSASGLAIGDRLQVRRDGRVIGEVEVVFTAERSASARVLGETEPIRPGDRARRLGGATATPSPPAEPAQVPAPRPASPAVGAPPPPPPARATEAPSRRRVTRASGTLGLEWRGTGSGNDDGDRRDSTRSLARLNLRVADIAGTPLQLRVRGRLFDLTREGQRPPLPASESRDRLYEAALIYDPPGSRFGLRAGRLGGAPLIGLGYLDGALVELRPLRRLGVGVAYGRRAEGAELGGSSDAPGGGGTKAGAFVRFDSDGAVESGQRTFSVALAGFREESADGRFGRDYVALESHVDGGESWSLFQHAELDLDVPTSAAAEGGQQLSLASVTLMRRLERGGRVALSYDRFQRYPTEEDLTVPAELLDRFARQGLRLGWSREGAGGLRLAVDAGARFREDAPPIHPELGPFGEAETTFSLRVGAHHRRLLGGLTAGIDLTGFTSTAVDGGVAAVRVGKRFAAGHEIDVSIGGSLYTAPLDERTLAWGRASLWVELPADLFARGELEILAGEDLDGRRLNVGIGYRL